MATTITAASIAPVLQAAAERLAALPHARVVRVDLHRALWESASQYDIAQASLEAFAGYLQAAGHGRWLHRWSVPRGRDEVAAELRAAAEGLAPRPQTDALASADQSFDWTRKLDGQVRRDVTTLLEVGDRAFSHVRPVVPGGEG